MSEKKSHSFFTGALIGLGVGLLLAPKENSLTKEKLKNSLEELLDRASDIDIEELKNSFLDRLSNLKEDLVDMPDKTKISFIQNKLDKIKNTCNDIIDIAKEKKVIKIETAAKTVLNKVEEILNEINLKEIEAPKEIKEEKEKKPAKRKRLLL